MTLQGGKISWSVMKKKPDDNSKPAKTIEVSDFADDANQVSESIKPDDKSKDSATTETEEKTAEPSDDDSMLDDLKKPETEEDEDSYVDALVAGNKDQGDPKAKDSADTDDVVDEVVKEEGDRLLKSEDEALERQFEPPKGSKSLKSRLKNAVVFWWEHKKLRYLTFFVLFLAITAVAFVPPARYLVLNTAGVRVRSSMNIVDSQTGLPLKNIPVSLQGQQQRSDDEGYIEFSDLKLGNALLIVEKPGYAKYEKDLVLGWGSNPIGDQPLSAVGTQFTFLLSEWLSGKPIKDAEAISGEDIAQVDEEGRIVLTVGELGEDTEATIRGEGYREEKLLLSKVADEQEVKLAPARKHVFVSNRTGEYDLYKIDVDGMNEEILLEASGKEREIPHVRPHPTKDYVAYISTRDGEINSDGFVLDGLFVIDVLSGDTKRIVRSEQIQIVGWDGNKIVYTAVTEGVSGGNPERSRLFSFDIDTGEKVQLASSNYFNDVRLVEGKVYYSVSSFAVPLSAAKLFAVNPDGTDPQEVIGTQVWTIVRAGFNTLHFRAVNADSVTTWFTKEGDKAVEELESPPVKQVSTHYSTSPNSEFAFWVDERDGKGVLLKYDVAKGEEEILRTSPGLSDPVYWLNDDYIVYRIATSQETADYIMSVDGGEPQKVADVIGNRSRRFY